MRWLSCLMPAPLLMPLPAAGQAPAPDAPARAEEETSGRARRKACEALLDAADAAALDSRDPRAADRARMVRNQIFLEGVSDPRVIDALLRVPREEFVPPLFRARAYEDTPLPIGEDQTISQPFIVGFMSEALGLTGGEKVLEIGTGSGYQAAVLARLAREVYSIEIVAPLARRAKETLARLKVENVRLRTGDGHQGWPEAAPFDAVIVTCAPEDVPPRLVEQLRPGGRIVIPVGSERGDQKLMRVTRHGTVLRYEELLPVRFVPMTGREKD
jgi:protein-L-isoaspartate(D-aspartate) O-methyltransferase